MFALNQKCILVVCCWCLWMTASDGFYELRIKPFKAELEASVGSSAVFTCEVCAVEGVDDGGGGDGEARIQWFKTDTGREISAERGRVFIENDGTKIKKLFLKDIHENDAGEYKCSVKANHLVDSKSIVLLVYKDISFDHVPNPQHPRIHTTALIECQASSHPPPVMSWKFNGEAILYGPKYKQVARGLQVSNVTRADNGNYTCSAEVGSEGRYEEKTITVVAHVPPMMVHGPTEESGTEGNEMSLYCKAESDPMPSYEFYKIVKGAPEKLLTSSSSDRIQVDSHLGRITFKPLKSEDSGSYRCKAVNDAGETSSNISLHVAVPPLIYEFKNKTVHEGESVTLTCKSRGDPNPYMIFQKNRHSSYKIGPNDNEKVVVSSRVPNSIEMKIAKPQPHHNSLYFCTSENLAGVTNASAYLSVLYKPRFSANQSKEEYSWSGRVHNITCQAHSNPAPTFHWIKNHLPLTNNDTFTISNTHRNTSLQIRMKEADQGWIFGEYICKVSNTRGSKDMKIRLKKASLPGSPLNIMVAENTPNLVVLEVMPPKSTGGVRLVGYRVEYQKKIVDYAVNETIVQPHYYGRHDLPGSFLTIENLRPNTSYTVMVRSKNQMGVGQPESAIFTTPTLSKPYPIKLTSPKEGKDPWSYKIKWEKPKSGGKPVTEYEIKYKKVRVRHTGAVESLEAWNIEHLKDNYYHPQTHFTLHYLAPLSSYQVQVFAKTDLGRSNMHPIFIFKTADKSQRMGSYMGSTGLSLPSSPLLLLLFFIYFVNQ